MDKKIIEKNLLVLDELNQFLIYINIYLIILHNFLILIGLWSFVQNKKRPRSLINILKSYSSLLWGYFAALKYFS